MTNAWQELQTALRDGETVEAIVFGQLEPDIWTTPTVSLKPPYGKLLTLEEAKQYLDQPWTFDTFHSGLDTFPVYCWTSERILFVSCSFDGYSLEALPRHPHACNPEVL